jgi:hypothetical protein
MCQTATTIASMSFKPTSMTSNKADECATSGLSKRIVTTLKGDASGAGAQSCCTGGPLPSNGDGPSPSNADPNGDPSSSVASTRAALSSLLAVALATLFI